VTYSIKLHHVSKVSELPNRQERSIDRKQRLVYCGKNQQLGVDMRKYSTMTALARAVS